MPEKDFEIFGEILSSDRMLGFSGWNGAMYLNLGDDPSILWERIKWDPWTAMAIFEDMEDKDSTLFSNLEKRRDGVLSLPRHVKPASDSRQDKKIAAFIEETLEQYWGGNASTLDNESHEVTFESFLSEALEAVGDGVTIGETIFGNASDRIFIEEVKFKPQQLFSFGDTALAPFSTNLMAYPQTGRLRLRAGVLVDEFGMGAPLPETKFFVFSSRPRKANRWGSPLKRKVFWQTWIKRNGVKAWLKYIEKGSGTVIARYNDGAPKEEQQNAVDAASAVTEENAVAIPKKFIMEVHEMVRNIGTSHKELVDDYCNAEIAKAIVGQTLTGRGSDGGGSRALGEVHERVEQKKIEADAKALMDVINKRIVRPLVFLNFGPNAKCPTWELEYEQGESLDAMADRYAKLRKDVGLPLSKKHLYEAFQEPEPVDEEDTLGGEKPEAEKPEDALDAKTLEFAEKKKILVESGGKSSLKTERFKRLRPSMIQFSDE
jgi:phage gp29-like protein